jgi:ABC-type uncharacterized transport system substrate-binding protein
MLDRILLGAKPAEFPVQLPTKFEMALNLRAAKALGIDVPQSIMLRADEVIESSGDFWFGSALAKSSRRRGFR